MTLFAEDVKKKFIGHLDLFEGLVQKLSGFAGYIENLRVKKILWQLG